MLRLPRNPRVRRRLFASDDLTRQANIDNCMNMIQESINRDSMEKSRKWNFDFKNEVPLEGVYEWYPCNDKADWVGVQSDKECDTNKDSSLPMKLENEVTPRNRDEEAVPAFRKRRRNTEVVTYQAVRRKLTFD